MSKDYYQDATLGDFQTELVGKRVVAASGNRIELEDGTRLTLVDTGDCCAWFSASDVQLLDLEDNLVTAVTSTDLDPEAGDYDDQHYRIHVLSRAGTIAEFDIEGNPTNGYYCHSINLWVTRAGEGLT